MWALCALQLVNPRHVNVGTVCKQFVQPMHVPVIAPCRLLDACIVKVDAPCSLGPPLGSRTDDLDCRCVFLIRVPCIV